MTAQTGPRRPQDGSNSHAEVSETVDFLLFIDRLKEVTRESALVSGKRREQTAEHSWHVAMAVLSLYQYAGEEIALGRALELAIVHDLPEAVVGDTFAYSPDAGSRRAKEEPAMQTLANRLGGHAGAELINAWQDYEYERTPEGRFVMAIDVLLPIFINLATGPRSSWVRHHIRASDVRSRVERVREAIPLLADLAFQAIDEAAAVGLLR